MLRGSTTARWRDTLHRLEEDSLVETITHTLSPRSRARRWFLTPAGIAEFARRRRQDESPDDLLKVFPLTTQWRRNLLGRLDAVAVINRMAQHVAEASERPRKGTETKQAAASVTPDYDTRPL